MICFTNNINGKLCSRTRLNKNIWILWTVCLLVISIEILNICLEVSSLKRKSYFLKYLPAAENATFRIKPRRDLMDIFNSSDPKYPLKMDGDYLLENKTFCSSTVNITVLFFVLSSTKNALNRQVLRRAWANESLYSSYGTVRTLFLLGHTNEPNTQAKIEEEFQRFGDILQGSFIDTYHNLSYKSIMGYKWVTERCTNAKYIIKIDDDIVVNMYGIFRNHVLERVFERHHVFCLRHINAPIVRNRTNKFYLEPHQFKGKKFYPPYCNGQFVAMLGKIIPDLYVAATQAPLFWISDVFMYGMVMQNMHALKYKTIQMNEIGKYGNGKSSKCLEVKRENCPILYFVTTYSKQVLELWSSIEDVYR